MTVGLPILEYVEIRPDGVTGPRDIRSVRTLRISVTDRCNFRCVYCMPEDKLDWVPRDSLLSFEEICEVARAAIRHGITAFKITGGEPLVRHDLPRLVAMLRGLPGATELSMTTNGALLDSYAGKLKAAGLDRLTVSMDTMDREKFRTITRGADLDQVWRGIRAALAAGFRHPKINCVAMRGINDNEFADFAALTRETDLTVRFIEYMPLGRTALGGEYEERFVSEEDIREQIVRRLGPLDSATKDTGSGPAIVWKLRGGVGRIGFISAMSKPFCETCNRLRLTAEGQLRSCLFDGGEVELRPILRSENGGRRIAIRRLRREAIQQEAIHREAIRQEGIKREAIRREAIQNELHEAFIRCVAFKPEVHSYHGNRQMSQIGG